MYKALGGKLVELRIAAARVRKVKDNQGGEEQDRNNDGAGRKKRAANNKEDGGSDGAEGRVCDPSDSPSRSFMPELLVCSTVLDSAEIARQRLNL